MTKLHRAGFCILVFAAFAPAGCSGRERPQLPTVPGPEATDLLASTRGYLVTPHRAARDGIESEISLIAVPSLAERVLQPQRQGSYLLVGSASGPDERGRIAYVQSNGTGDSARLNMLDRDGTNREIAAATGPQYEVFGTSPTLAPIGGAVAFMTKVRSSWPNGEEVRSGTLAVWRPETDQVAAIGTDAIDERVAWFPDGNRLAYVARVPRETLERGDAAQLTAGAPNCTGGASREDTLSLIYTVDVRSGVRRALHAGTNPVVSTDGSAVMLDLCGFVLLVDSVGQHAKMATLPGNLHRPLALLDGHLVVYWALQTSGAAVERSPYGSFAAGTQLVSIKVTDLTTGHFQTIIPAIDPRWEASFQPAKNMTDTLPSVRKPASIF